MKLPMLNELETTRDMIDVFKGYNHNLRIGEGEFYDTKNLTSTYYPVLSPRGRRGVYPTPEGSEPQALIQKDSLCYVDGADFIVNGYRVRMGLSTRQQDCPKTLVSMGAYVIIMPDKKYINIADVTDFGSIEASVTTNTTVSFELCRVDGSSYIDAQASAEEPEAPNNMDYWIDTSTTPHTLKQYSASNAMWMSIATTYIKIYATGIGKPFEVNDGVTISGIEDESLSDLNNTMVIWDKGDDYIVVTGILDAITTQESPITIKRQMPNMDFIIESENRLWGCRYGHAVNGEVVNEIYASKLGDFKNWNCFMGISTDSYAASVGSDGQFTGAIAHLGHPLFFKENCLHKVYGNYPANYQITTTACRGVQKGSHKSLAIVNEVLYYKSRTAICAYDGSLPQEISYALGDVAYDNAVACSHGNKYYISMREEAQDESMWTATLLSGNMLFVQQSYCIIRDGDTLAIDGWELPSSISYERAGKNLLPFPYKTKGQTITGVTFSENLDGTVCVNGDVDKTAGVGGAYFTLAGGYFVEKYPVTDLFVKGKTYTISGGAEKVQVVVYFYKADGTGVRFVDTFTVEDEYEYYGIFVYSPLGFTADNVTVEPMLVEGDKAISYDTYIRESEEALKITQAYSASMNTRLLALDKDDGSEDGTWNLFVYDTSKGLWHKEDNTRVDDFCSCSGELYYIDHYDGRIKTMFGSGEEDSHKVEWVAETGIIGTDHPDKKYISKLNIRLNLDLASRICVYIQYDSCEKWEELFKVEGTSLRSFTVPVRPKRCDHMRLRIEGEGEAKIYSISKTIEQGSDSR